MDSVIDLVEKYRQAETLEKRYEYGGAIISFIGPKISAYIFARCLPGVAEDISQKTLFGIVEGLRIFRGQTEGAFWSWCRQIARNKTNDHLREKLKDEVLVPIETAEVENAFELVAKDDGLSAGDRIDLEDAMKLLSSRNAPCCYFLYARYVWDETYAEIALRFDMTEDAAGKKIRKCLELVKMLVAKRR